MFCAVAALLWSSPWSWTLREVDDCPSRAYDREAKVCPWYAGEVGDGTGIAFGEVFARDPPDIEAVRWLDAAVAAAEGSREEESINVLPC